MFLIFKNVHAIIKCSRNKNVLVYEKMVMILKKKEIQIVRVFIKNHEIEKISTNSKIIQTNKIMYVNLKNNVPKVQKNFIDSKNVC